MNSLPSKEAALDIWPENMALIQLFPVKLDWRVFGYVENIKRGSIDTAVSVTTGEM